MRGAELEQPQEAIVMGGSRRRQRDGTFGGLTAASNRHRKVNGVDNGVLKSVWPMWQIERRIGRGSFGVVYEAVRREGELESRAAIKIISIPEDEGEIGSLRSEGLSEDQTRQYLKNIVDDFVSEIRLMETFKGCENIVSVEDYAVIEREDAVGWHILIRMELLTPFTSYICDRKLDEEEVIRLGIDLCRALERFEQRNVIHRDIKPENIFVNQFGDFKIGDLGVARGIEALTGELSVKGSVNYMAPEMENGAGYDRTVDIYAAGLVLYRMLNKNRLPFLNTERQLLNPTERAEATRRRMGGEELPLPCEASPAMAELILKACAPAAADRFQSAEEMKQALKAVREGQKSEARGLAAAKAGEAENVQAGTFSGHEETYINQTSASAEEHEAERASEAQNEDEADLLSKDASDSPAKGKLNDRSKTGIGRWIAAAAALVALTLVAVTAKQKMSVAAEAAGDGGRRLHPTEITASSELEPYTENGHHYSYYGLYVDDDDMETMWSEGDGTNGLGIGEYLDFSVPAGTVITRVEIFPGHLRTEQSFWRNSAVSDLQISSGGTDVMLNIPEDALHDFESAKKGYSYILEEPLVSDGTIRFRITDVRKGTDWQDTSITELHIYGYEPGEYPEVTVS